jgi:hypothetical protein
MDWILKGKCILYILYLHVLLSRQCNSAHNKIFISMVHEIYRLIDMLPEQIIPLPTKSKSLSRKWFREEPWKEN